MDISTYFSLGVFFALLSAVLIGYRFAYVRKHGDRYSMWYNPAVSGMLMFLSFFLILFWIFALPVIILIAIVAFVIHTIKEYS